MVERLASSWYTCWSVGRMSPWLISFLLYSLSIIVSFFLSLWFLWFLQVGAFQWFFAFRVLPVSFLLPSSFYHYLFILNFIGKNAFLVSVYLCLNWERVDKLRVIQHTIHMWKLKLYHSPPAKPSRTVYFLFSYLLLNTFYVVQWSFIKVCIHVLVL